MAGYSSHSFFDKLQQLWGWSHHVWQTGQDPRGPNWMCNLKKSGRLAWDVTGENDDQTYIWGSPYFLTTHICCDNFGWHSTLGTSSPAPTCMDLMAPAIRWNLYGFGVIRTGEIHQFDSILMINHGFLGLQYPMGGQNSNWSLRIVEYQSENPVPFPSSFSAENSPARPLTRSKLTHGYFLFLNLKLDPPQKWRISLGFEMFRI